MSSQRGKWEPGSDSSLFGGALDERFDDGAPVDDDGDATMICTMPIDELVSTIADGRYEILRIIGEGGMATVYEAFDKHTGERIALKLLTQTSAGGQFAERFQREIELISALDSHHIVKVHGAGTLADGRPYLTEELLLGVTLRDLIDTDGPMPPGRAARILDAVLSALEAAHEAGIVHRDLKPDNVFVINLGQGDETAKILDFGFATKIEELDRRLTRAGMAVGTPKYMAPEQFLQLTMDARTDLYAVGVLLYKMLAGRAPFEDDDPVPERVRRMAPGPKLGWMHLNLEPKPLPNIPRGLHELMFRLLEKSPTARYDSAREVRVAMRAIGKHAPGSGRGGIATERTTSNTAVAALQARPSAHSGLLLKAAVAAVAAFLGAAGAWFLAR